mmetsp:Transcript_12665/g.18951  ORF Transcript_12665/g.18951 Transcript_12665/m.18951 type:complete len:698 (-) Transcript_12665:73-2166(-)
MQRKDKRGISFLKEGTGEAYELKNTAKTHIQSVSHTKASIAKRFEDVNSLKDSYLKNARERARKNTGDYFDDSEDEISTKQNAYSTVNEEEDPLDAFMAGISQTVKEEEAAAGKEKTKPSFLDEDPLNDTAYKDDKMKIPDILDSPGSGADYDMDGFPTGRVPEDKKVIEGLPPVDHAKIEYEPFRKNFYTPAEDIKKMYPSQIMQLREDLQISVEGRDVPVPIESFKQAGFSDNLLLEIIKQGFEAPTPIQSQALPVALSGRDIIGVAKTGSGKTLAFVWPMLMHVCDQRFIEKGEGPIAVILSPTRELATQIYSEAKKFAKKLDVKVCAVFGGAGKWEMKKALKEGPEIVIATPGRLIEMIKTKATNLLRCTMVVLDEADRMFDLGFGYQMRSIVDQIRPSRQTMLFSATFKRKVEQLARDVLNDPIRVNIGAGGSMTANEDIKQVVEVLDNDLKKWPWLVGRIDGFVENGKVLIFVKNKVGCEELCKSINMNTKFNGQAAFIHGDKDQTERESTLRQFRHGTVKILVATDVASRGLDIKDVNTVVSYDMAKNIETHIHRVGRTGRMSKEEGVKVGAAFTLFTPKQHALAADMVKHLNNSKQAVPAELISMIRNPGMQQQTAKISKGGIGSRDAPKQIAIPDSQRLFENVQISTQAHHFFTNQEMQSQTKAPWKGDQKLNKDEEPRIRKKSRWGN